jgi:hypothetical protein
VFKINTLLPVKHLKLILGGLENTNGATVTLAVSLDNITYTNVYNKTTATGVVEYRTSATSISFETDLVNSASVFYVKWTNSTGDNRFYWLKALADLDTSSIPQGLLYPITSPNQFTETVKLPSVATRAYFRLNKFTNEYGIVVPAIEFTDASAVTIGYVPLKLDNSQETNPCIDILSTTTNWQQSGTGSNDSTTGYILNDGEYITFTSTTNEIKIDFKVGTGTTAFAGITKNTLYLSSNSESNDATQDPSLQGNFIVGIRQQGLTDRVKDISSEIEDVKNGVVKTSIWNNWIPVLTWTTGTPEGSVVTKARYKILDGVCYFAFYYSATDANGATALTISLPVLPKDNDSLTALQSQELADTTWSNPIAYINDGGTSIVFRSFATIADTKAVKVLVSGSYEI